MRHKILAFSIVMFVLLAAGLEWLGRYHFFMIEQYQLFLLTGDYFFDMVAQPGGVALWVAEFLVQFFAVPYAGALLTALVLTGVGVFTTLMCRRMAPGAPLWLAGVLPVLGLLCVSFNLNYLYQGSVALLGVTVLLWLWTKPTRFCVRLAVAAVAMPLAFWLFGSVAMLFALCVVLWEALNGTRRWWLSLAIAVEAALVGWVAVHFSMVGDWKFALSPMLYFITAAEAEPWFWFAWAGVPVALVCARLCGGVKVTAVSWRMVWMAAQSVAVALIVWKLVIPCSLPGFYEVKRLYHYAWAGDWDAIIERAGGSKSSDYMSLCHLNLALAEKGVLADEMFKYDQWDVKGLIYPWDRTLPAAIIRSDILFDIGMIAGAQQMAFEGMVSAPGHGSSRLLRRLVQTNLIYGAWPVAEKYLDILSCAPLHRDWAEKHRRFLYDDEAVEADPLLGTKRRCLPDESRFFANMYGDIELIARQNPSNRTAVEYLGALALLAHDRRFFCTMIESYYGTEILPSLPRSLQEAVVFFWADSPETWERFGVSAHVRERFDSFTKRMMETRDRQGQANLMRREYGDTYWFYHLLK